MKKTIAILTGLVTTAALAATIDSGNTFGFLPATPTAGANNRKMLAIPFENYGASGSSITVSEIILTSTLATGDKLYIAKDGGYDVYTLKNTGAWEPAKKVTINSDGTVSTTETDSPTTAPISRGQGVWIETAATTINLMGQSNESTTAVTVCGSGTAGTWKFNLVGASTASKDVTLSSTFGKAGDRIMLADGTMYINAGGAWKTTKRGDASSVKIPAGTGFWYLVADSGTTSLTL